MVRSVVTGSFLFPISFLPRRVSARYRLAICELPVYGHGRISAANSGPYCPPDSRTASFFACFVLSFFVFASSRPRKNNPGESADSLNTGVSGVDSESPGSFYVAIRLQVPTPAVNVQGALPTMLLTGVTTMTTIYRVML